MGIEYTWIDILVIDSIKTAAEAVGAELTDHILTFVEPPEIEPPEIERAFKYNGVKFLEYTGGKDDD